MRFRVDFPIRPSTGGRAIRPDIVFTRERLAIFVDGCFWHGCPEHGTLPAATNAQYWEQKIAENRARDDRHTLALEEKGWTVIRVWEHEPIVAVVRRVEAALGERRQQR